jgi:hypothetical protein
MHCLSYGAGSAGISVRQDWDGKGKIQNDAILKRPKRTEYSSPPSSWQVC